MCFDSGDVLAKGNSYRKALVFSGVFRVLSEVCFVLLVDVREVKGREGKEGVL